MPVVKITVSRAEEGASKGPLGHKCDKIGTSIRKTPLDWTAGVRAGLESQGSGPEAEDEGRGPGNSPEAKSTEMVTKLAVR